jgi:hypothetical protein
MLIRRLVLPPLALFTVLVAACSGSAGAPSGGSEEVSRGTISSPEQAFERVRSQDARFAQVERKNADIIGQCCWYQAQSTDAGYTVLVHVGWGDCPSGCIHKHEWTYTVGRDGAVVLASETGDKIPPGNFPPDGGDT